MHVPIPFVLVISSKECLTMMSPSKNIIFFHFLNSGRNNKNLQKIDSGHLLNNVSVFIGGLHLCIRISLSLNHFNLFSGMLYDNNK